MISDTHNWHEDLELGNGDLLIHAGDFTDFGMEYEVEDFIHWFARQNYRHKIFIAGNHDLFMESVSQKEMKQLIPDTVTYLENRSITIEGVKIFGSPVTPYYFGMAFNEKRGKAIQKVWNKIPNDTDILITHGPPLGILDNDLGCEDLLQSVQKNNPRLHVFGHIHEAKGMIKSKNTIFANASIMH